MFHAEIYFYSTNQIIEDNCRWPFGRVVKASACEASGHQNLFRLEANLEF